MSSFICVSWALDGGMAHNKMFLEEGLQLSYNLTDTLITSKLDMSQSWLTIFKMKSHIPMLFPYFSYLKHHCITYPRQFCDRELSIDLFYSFRHSEYSFSALTASSFPWFYQSTLDIALCSGFSFLIIFFSYFLRALLSAKFLLTQSKFL